MPMNAFPKCENFRQCLSVAYLVNNAVSKGCCGQGQRPSQSAADTSSGVEPFSYGNIDGGSGPVLMRLQRSGQAFLRAESAVTTFFLKSAALEVATHAMPRR
jgi:hypothetical protein